MRPTIIIQSTVGRLGALGVAVFGLLLLAVETLAGGPPSLLRALPWVALVVLAAWLSWGSARVILDDKHLVLDNPFSKVEIPWTRISAARSQWSLAVEAEGQEYKAWAAPARSSASFTKQRVDVATEVPAASPGTHPLRWNLDARGAALLITDEAALRVGHAPDTNQRRVRGDVAGQETVSRQFRWGRLAAVAVLVLLATLTTF